MLRLHSAPLFLFSADGHGWGHSRPPGYELDIVKYQGRCGILPQILTDEEKDSYYDFWGMEHQ